VRAAALEGQTHRRYAFRLGHLSPSFESACRLFADESAGEEPALRTRHARRISNLTPITAPYAFRAIADAQSRAIDSNRATQKR
jgi:hypothetical protein